MRIKKLITPELVEELLNKTEYNEQESHNEEHVQHVVLDHYHASITDDWNKACNYFIYEETTADGYSVYIATHDDKGSVCVPENVHYYDNDLGKELKSAIADGLDIYISELDAYYVEDTFRQMFTNLVELKEQEIVDNLIDEGYEQAE